MNKKKRGSSPTAIWIILVIALLVFGVLKYKLSNGLAAAKQKLSDATTAREEQLAVTAQGEQLAKRSDELRKLISNQHSSIGATFSAFSNPEMLNALSQRLEIPSDIGVLIAKSYGSHFLWASKGEQQNVVLYAKLFPADTRGWKLDLISKPDHRIEIPLEPEQLTVLTSKVRETDSGVELFWQLGEHKPTTIPFKGFSNVGDGSSGLSRREIFKNTLGRSANLFDSNKPPVRQETLFKKGIWDLIVLDYFKLKSDKEEKRLQIAIVIESSGPLYVSPPNKHVFSDGFELTWEEAKAAYRVELKSE